MTPPDHGTLSRYQHWSCKCKPCTETGQAYAKNQRHNRRNRVDALPADQHGKRSTYDNWGCRCPDCTAVNAEYHKNRRRQQR